MDNNQQTPQKEPGGYKKRPLWFWILIYVGVAIIVYGILYIVLTAGSYDVTSYLSK